MSQNHSESPSQSSYEVLTQKLVLPHNTPSIEAVDQGQWGEFGVPIYDRAEVESRSGISGHEFLGTISSPSSAAEGAQGAQEYLVFRAGTVEGGNWSVPLVFSSANSPVNGPNGMHYKPQAPGSITLLPREAFNSLVILNGHNPAAWDAVDPQSVGDSQEAASTPQKRRWISALVGRWAVRSDRRAAIPDDSHRTSYIQRVSLGADVIEPPARHLPDAVSTPTIKRYGWYDGLFRVTSAYGRPKPGDQRFSVMVDEDSNVGVLNTSFTEDVTLTIAA